LSCFKRRLPRPSQHNIKAIAERPEWLRDGVVIKIGDDAILYTEVAAEGVDKHEWYASEHGIVELPFESMMDDPGIDSGKACN
jgi:hypothetical protein